MKKKIIDIISNAEGVDKDTIKEIKEYLNKIDDSFFYESIKLKVVKNLKHNIGRILEGKDKAMERFTNKLKEKEEE